ncbi:MAG: aldo/keto reductase [Rubrivivax sp.]|nr:aldo/keto reductase [Rubrivivax sp.]
MKTRRIGPFEVAEIGFGGMNLSHAYGTPPPVEAAEALLLEALDRGMTLIDTAALYGFGANETLIGRVLKPHRSRIVLCSKGGMTGQPVGPGGALQRVIDGRPESIQRDCEASLKRLQTDVIDLYYLHRWDKTVPIEDSVGAMSRLVDQGKVRTLGLSEVSAATLRKAHAVHPIAALQTEYSLWTRNPEIAVLAACREIGAAFVAFSPTGRAFLTGALRDVAALDAKDIRRSMPRFEPAHYAKNLALLPPFEALAQELGATPVQLALAWLLAQGPEVIPLPGTTQRAHLVENLGACGLALPSDVLARLDALFTPSAISGNRYGAQSQNEVDTEQF